MIQCPLPKEGYKTEMTRVQLFIINIIASLADAFSNIPTPPESVHSHFLPIRFFRSCREEPGGEDLPSKSWHVQDARAGEAAGERKGSRSATLAGSCWLRAVLWARGARGRFIPEGTASRGEDTGRAWVLRATGEPTVESTWFCLALFSNSALNQLEEEC